MPAVERKAGPQAAVINDSKLLGLADGSTFGSTA